MSTQSDLLNEVEAFLSQSGMSPTRLGVLAINDGKFVARLRSGKNITAVTIDRVRDFMTKQLTCE